MLDFDDALVDEAKKVLYGNLRIGYSKWAKSEYKYISPSYPHYPHQWFWDSCFHAIALSHIDIGLAKNEIRSLLKAQRKNGFMPHVIYWGATKFRRPLAGIGAMLESKFSLFPKTTDMIQPPLIAQSVERIYQEEKDLEIIGGKTKLKLYRGKGCDKCSDSGYKGRIAIFEVMSMSETIGRLVLERSPAGKIEELAVEEGMIRLLQDGYLKVVEGITTMEEILRVARDYNEIF